jgi:hypothetical protein
MDIELAAEDKAARTFQFQSDRELKRTEHEKKIKQARKGSPLRKSQS